MKVRTSFKHVKRRREGQSIGVDYANHEGARLQSILHNSQPKDIFNIDETGLLYAMLLSKGPSSRMDANILKKAK